LALLLREVGICPERALADEAIAAVKNGLDAPFGMFAYILLFTGLRRGELLALRYEDIDRENKTITVNKSVTYLGNTASLKLPKTKNGIRTVDLLDNLLSVLPDGSGYIFSMPDGKPLTKTAYRKRWAKYCNAIGYEITAHQLRHGYATLLYEAGIADKDAQELLGHSNITTTRNVYTHIRQSHREERTQKLNDYIGKL
ncbi:MAG: site-specific integrase, partial [Clostridia bacterium]|nr:site-specific integrase [Clostridia bacterium]